ncbi:MAG: endonuclease domain-containing protein [Gammaproteobacteria bacterium]|nr:endonuclease domain-containing protein [Gammaproteobacteria bacterium]MDH5594151.1 endonuclease domain-containing protein [Gammaproteobacteria bacterium]
MAKGYARYLRCNLTDAEKLIWQYLRKRQLYGYKFRRQQPIGKYIVDFVCFEKKLVIELDGGQHTEQTRYDELRTIWLNSQEFNVLRFWNNEVFNETEAVIERIAEILITPTLTLPHKGGGDKGRRIK